MTTQVCELDNFSVIKLSGQDSVSFLQGQVTCDITQLKDKGWLPGCHCNAKGKMWSSFIALAHGDDILLVMSKESAQFSLAELNKYGVFAKTDITDDSENWHVYGANQALDSAHSLELAEDHFICLAQTPVATNSNSELWWKAEVLSARAHLFEGTIGEYVPQMLNLQALDYISFSKGCYMGQEMVARMKYLGKNKRALYLAKVESEIVLNTAEDVAVELNGNKRNVGKVIMSQIADGATYLQLVLPKDTELTETLYLGSGQTVKLLELPYELEQQGS